MTDQIRYVATLEEIDRWIEQFKGYCEAQHIELDPTNKEFIALERAFWMGIVTSNGPEVIPVESGLQMLLFAYRSPVFDYKSPLKKRVRRTKAQMEAEQQQAAVQPFVEPPGEKVAE